MPNNIDISKITSVALSVLVTFVIAFLFFRFAGPVPISVQQTTTAKQSTFDVVGEGSHEAVPDEAVVSFGITTSSSTVAGAQSQADRVVRNLTRELVALGVKEDDIKTTSYTISPDYSFSEGSSRIVGYSVTSNLEVRFADFEILNQAIDKAVETGANLVGSLQFRLSKNARVEAEQKAREEATAAAKDKAKQVAAAAGISLGKIVNVQENIVGDGGPIILRQSLEVAEDASAQVSPGVSEVKIRTTLSYEIR